MSDAGPTAPPADSPVTLPPPAVIGPPPPASPTPPTSLPLGLLSLVLENLPDGVVVADLEGRVILSNRAAEELVGLPLTPSDLAQWSDRSGIFLADGSTRFPPDDLPLARAIRGESTDGVEMIIRNEKIPNGVHLSTSGRPLLVEGKGLVGGLVAYRDVTDNFRAELGSIRLASIIASSDDAILLRALDGTILEWNPAAERVYGWLAIEARGKNDSIIVPSDRKEELALLVARIAKGERVEHVETVRKRKDGSLIEVLLSFSPIHGPMGQVVGISVIGRDIGELKRARRAESDLASDEGRRDLFERVPIGLFRIGAKGEVLDANPAAVRILGFGSIEELRKTRLEALLAHPGDMERWVAAGLNTGAEQSIEFQVRRPDGSLIWARAAARGVLGPDGRVLRYDGSIEDITEREATSRLRQEMIDIVSHEFRTPISIIQGYAHLLTGGSLDAKPEAATEAKRTVDRAARRLTFLLTMVSELDALRSGKFDVVLGSVQTSEVLDEALAALEWKGKTAGREFGVEVAAGAEVLTSDRRKLTLALTELLDNAVKFAPLGSPVDIRVLLRGDKAVFEVDDEGPGLPPHVLRHLGRPFVQGDMSATRLSGGAGLGLAVVTAIAEALGGGLEFEPRSTKGTRARLTVASAPRGA